MTRSRRREVLRMSSSCPEQKARELYLEVMGAWPSDSVPLARVRASIAEAIAELEEGAGAAPSAPSED